LIKKVHRARYYRERYKRGGHKFQIHKYKNGKYARGAHIVYDNIVHDGKSPMISGVEIWGRAGKVVTYNTDVSGDLENAGVNRL